MKLISKFELHREVQYGGIGMTMAHELTHLFLPHGCLLDSFIFLIHMWQINKFLLISTRNKI